MFSACTCGIRTNFFVRKWEFLGLFSGEVWEHHRHHPRRHHLRRHHHHHPRTNLSRKTYPENAFESVGPLRLLSVLSSILMYDCLCLFVCLFVCLWFFGWFSLVCCLTFEFFLDVIAFVEEILRRSRSASDRSAFINAVHLPRLLSSRPTRPRLPRLITHTSQPGQFSN